MEKKEERKNEREERKTERRKKEKKKDGVRQNCSKPIRRASRTNLCQLF